MVDLAATKSRRRSEDSDRQSICATRFVEIHKAGTSNFTRVRPLAVYLGGIHGAKHPNDLISHVSFNPTETQIYVVIHDAITNSETLSQTFVSLFVIAIPGYYILPC